MKKWIICGMFDDFAKCPHCGKKFPILLIVDYHFKGCPCCLQEVQ